MSLNNSETNPSEFEQALGRHCSVAESCKLTTSGINNRRGFWFWGFFCKMAAHCQAHCQCRELAVMKALMLQILLNICFNLNLHTGGLTACFFSTVHVCTRQESYSF